jgi:hypothetical protein
MFMLLRKFLRRARHVDALALRVVEPPVIAATQPLLLDPSPLERRTAVRAMRLECPDASLLVTEDDELLVKQLHFLRQIVQLIRGTDGLPIPAQELTRRTPWLDRRSAHSRVAVSAVRRPISLLPPMVVVAVW